jgi:hypothetical protein
MTLIGGYARSPQPEVADRGSDPGGAPDIAGDELTGDELTSASRTELPPVPSPRPGPRHGAPSGRGRRPGGQPPEEPGHRNRRVRFGLVAAGCVVGAAALVVGGAYLGPKIDPGVTASNGSASGPVPGENPPTAPPTGTSSTPKLALGQPMGDGVTGYVIHGMGFIPGTTVSVSLVGHGTSTWHPVVDPKGTFNYTIDQDHLFFPHDIPIGNYQIVVTGPDDRRATARFEVSSPPPSPPPSGPPPSGRPPTGPPPTGPPGG